MFIVEIKEPPYQYKSREYEHFEFCRHLKMLGKGKECRSALYAYSSKCESLELSWIIDERLSNSYLRKTISEPRTGIEPETLQRPLRDTVIIELPRRRWRARSGAALGIELIHLLLFITRNIYYH